MIYVPKYIMLTLLVLHTFFLVTVLYMFIDGDCNIFNLIACIANQCTLFFLERISEMNIEIEEMFE